MRDAMEWRVIVADIIRQRREKLRLTQADVAERLKWSRPKLVAMERARQSITVEQLFQLADALQCHVYDLLPGEVQRNGKQRY